MRTTLYTSIRVAAGVGTPRHKPIDWMALLSELIASRSLAIYNFVFIFLITEIFIL